MCAGEVIGLLCNGSLCKQKLVLPAKDSLGKVLEMPHCKTRYENAPRVFEQNVMGGKLADKFRLQYLSKLSTEKVWLPQAQRSPNHQTALIFDWDDTLLCTSYLEELKDEAMPLQVKAHLRRIEQIGFRLLNTACQLGQTFIITNAVDGWVEKSAAEFLPGLMPALSKVRIISAQHAQKSLCLEGVHQWKVQAFLEVGRQFDSEVVTNLVSIGDSMFEVEAANVLSKEFTVGFLKTVKLQECPSSEDLLAELDILEAKLETIVQKSSNLNIRLGKTNLNAKLRKTFRRDPKEHQKLTSQSFALSFCVGPKFGAILVDAMWRLFHPSA